ncbi:MAG: hypothetical protein IPK14_12050 [Blastocatellia bacterium]|nr:hypothetical protein [Blastocatellia bacterium]
MARDIAPLMQWRNTRGHEEAYYFDLLIARLQNELLRKSAKFEDYKDELYLQFPSFQQILIKFVKSLILSIK